MLYFQNKLKYFPLVYAPNTVGTTYDCLLARWNSLEEISDLTEEQGRESGMLSVVCGQSARLPCLSLTNGFVRGPMAECMLPPHSADCLMDDPNPGQAGDIKVSLGHSF